MTAPPLPGGAAPAEPHVPSIDDVVDRFRSAWKALSELEAAGEQALSRSESLAERAYLDASKTIEGAVTCALVRARAGGDNPARLNFTDALTKLRKASPTLVSPTWADQLNARRKRRNQLEHGGGVVPKFAEIRATLREAERFLLEVLHISPEVLYRDLPGQKVEGSDASTWPRIFHLLVAPAARAQVLGDAVDRGVAKLRAQERHGEGLLRTLERDAASLMNTAARALWDARLGPGDPLPAYHPIDDYLRMEADLLDAARDGRPIDADKLRLLTRRVGLCEAAGWFHRDEGTLRFADEVVPAMALGAALVPTPDALVELLALLAVDPAWGLALQCSASGPADRASGWLRLLRGCDDPTTLVTEIVAHSFLLGALPPDTRIDDADLAASRDLVLHGLVHLGPRVNDPLAWQLPPRSFWACALCLASASATLRERLPDDPGPVPARLARLVDMLGLAPALPDGQDTVALAAFAMPWHALRARRLTGATSVQVQSIVQRAPVAEAHPMIPWCTSLIATLALEFDAAPLLCDLDHGGLGGVLIQNPDRHAVWIDAWSLVLAREPTRARSLWVRVLRDMLVPADARAAGDWGEQLFHPARDLLRAAKLEDETRADVRAGLLGWQFPDRATVSHRRLFKWADLKPEDWTAGLAVWKTRPSLAWMLLRDCGAPHSILAEWALHLLAEREALPPEQRKGPFGVMTSANVRVTQTGPWKAAFDEARACLEWLLDNGDRHAVARIADAALAPPGQRAAFDPPFVKSKVNLWFTLSQVLWQRVVRRDSGREVLYQRIADGEYIGIHSWPNFDWQWVVDAVAHDEALLAREAPRIFAAYVGYCSVAWEANATRHDQPWEHPPANVWVAVHTLMLNLAAMHGVMVLDGWTRVVTRYATEMPRFAPHVASVYAAFAERHPDESQAAAVDLADNVLAAMCVDGSELFWTTWLRMVGLPGFVGRIEHLRVADLGTGVILALSASNAAALAEKLREPRYFAPFLRATRDPSIYRDNSLRKALWESPREVRELEPLMNEPPGPWLAAFLEFSVRWPAATRTAACVAFARYADDPEVRRRCLVCLDETNEPRRPPDILPV